MSIWSVYMVRCSDGSLYTGISTDIEKRIRTHNTGKGAAYTRGRRPVSLVWFRHVSSESEARKMEAAIKKLSRPEKERLLS